MSKPTRVDYCQYLLSTPLNYTLTHFADHSESFSHDQINRYLAKDRLTPRQVWEHVAPDVIQTCEGYVIESLKKTYYCPMKSNRLVDDSGGERPYQRIDSLQWTPSEETTGKVVKLHKFPKHHKVKVFRVASARRTDYVVTNDLSQSDVSATQQVCGSRWKIEQLHRESKQLTGLGKCQCRLSRIVRNHICSAFLVWVHLTRRAYETGQTVYQVKHG